MRVRHDTSEMALKSKMKSIPTSTYADDISLVESAICGEEQAQRIIAQRLYSTIRTTVYYLTANHRDLEDFVQQAIVEVLRSLKTFRGRSSLETWGNIIAVRKTLKMLKDLRTKESTVFPNSNYTDAVSDDSDLENRLMMRRRLIQVMGSVSAKYRTVIMLSAVYGYNPDEIAQMLGSPRSTIRQRYRRGRKILAGKLVRDPVFAKWASARKK